MTCNLFSYSLLGETPFYLMLKWDAYMPTLFKLLLSKIRYMEGKKGRRYLDIMREIYMMIVLNLKTARDECPPHIKEHDGIEFKVGDTVLLKNHTPNTAFDIKYKTS